jgi:hypothetical protein
MLTYLFFGGSLLYAQRILAFHIVLHFFLIILFQFEFYFHKQYRFLIIFARFLYRGYVSLKLS